MSHFIRPVPNSDSAIYNLSHRLLAIAGNKILASGTCVNLCANLVLTAKHVLLDFEKRFGSKQYQLWIVQITNDDRSYAIWECVQGFALREQTDLMVLNIRPYDETTGELFRSGALSQPTLRLSPPPVGSTVTAFGFSSTEGGTKFSINSMGGPHFDVNDEPSVTQGLVQENYPIRRDSSMLNFPSFRIGFESRGGMSGGPVFDERGKLCGIISSGMRNDNTAYASSLGPLLDIPIDLHGRVRTGRIYCRSIREAVDSGFISITP